MWKYYLASVGVVTSVSISALNYSAQAVVKVRSHLISEYNKFENNVVHEIASKYGYSPTVAPKSKRTWEEIADEQAELQGLNKCLIRAVIAVESVNGKKQVSHAGALGYMQLMPKTAAAYGLKTDADILDPEQNIYAGTKHLKIEISKYGLFKGLQVYNAGPTRVGMTEENIQYPHKVLEAWRKCNT